MTQMRAVFHVHSTWSYDGHWSLRGLARFYGAFGVNAVLMTEHDTGFDPGSFDDYCQACSDASTPRCRLVPGIEYSSPENDIHMLTWGLDRFLAEHRPVDETLNAVSEASGAAIFAHPARCDAWEKFDPRWTEYLHGIEAWNRKTDGVAPGVQAARLIERTGLPPTVGQDFHKLRHFWPLTMRFSGDPSDPVNSSVAALREKRALPFAFGRPLLDAEGKTRETPHRRIETLRRFVRDLVRPTGPSK